MSDLKASRIEPFIPPDKRRHKAYTPPAPRGRISIALSVADRMRRKLCTKQGMKTVELVLGQIKQGRGFRQSLLRGIRKVKGKWWLICTGYNPLKLFRVWDQG